MTDAIDNAIDDMLLARIAGAGPDPDVDYSYTYPPYSHNAQPGPCLHNAQPGHMPTVADIHNERNHYRARCEILTQERDMLVGWVRELTDRTPVTGGIDAGVSWCVHCLKQLPPRLRAVTDHDPACPWRLAKEWMARQEGNDGNQ